jgi:hypothetical protein
MKSSCCLCLCESSLNKAGIVEPEDTAVALQQLGNIISAATNTHATIEEILDTMFSMRSVLYQILNSENKVGD